MQATLEVKHEAMMEVRSRWTQQERAERMLMANLKQRWLSEILGLERLWREQEQPSLPLVKAG